MTFFGEGGSGGGGSIGTGDASAANQMTQISRLEAIRDRLPNPLVQPVTDTQLRASAVPVSVAGVATSSNQAAGNATLVEIKDRLPNPLVQPLTDAQLRASAFGVTVAGIATAANQATSNTTLSAINDKTAALDAGRTQTVPFMATGGNLQLQTAATGSNWVDFSAQTCKQLTVSNQSDATIEVRQGGAGVGFQIPKTAFYTFFGVSNANQLSIRRVDQANTQIAITARWES